MVLRVRVNRSMVLLSVVFPRAVRVLSGDVLVGSGCGPRSQVVNRAMPLVWLVLVVSVMVRLMPLVRAVWLSCQASVVLVRLMVVCWRLVPVVVLRS